MTKLKTLYAGKIRIGYRFNLINRYSARRVECMEKKIFEKIKTKNLS